MKVNTRRSLDIMVLVSASCIITCLIYLLGQTRVVLF